MDLSCEPNIYVSYSTSKLKVRLGPIKMFALQCFFANRFKAVLLLWIFFVLLFTFHVCFCYAALSVPCGLASWLFCLLWFDVFCHFSMVSWVRCGT